MTDQNQPAEPILPTYDQCIDLANDAHEYLYTQARAGKPINEDVLVIRRWLDAWLRGDAYAYLYATEPVKAIVNPNLDV